MDPAQAILERLPDGADAVFGSSGQAEAFQSCFDVFRSNGSIVVFGIVSDKIKAFAPSIFCCKEPIV